MSSGLSDPHGVGESLNNELAGIDDAKYGQMRTTTGEEERWATTLFKDFLGLKAISGEGQNM